MVPFHPNHFDVALGVRKFADVSQELPVFLGEPAKIQVGKNVAQQDEAAKPTLPQHGRSIVSAAEVRTEMQVGEDERVVERRTHHSKL